MDRGFTLIEIMIVVAIISIIATFAIPNLLESKKTANEATAIGALRTLSSAQELYNTRFGSYGTLTQLGDRNVIDDVLASGTKSSYCFATANVGAASWCATAWPVNASAGERAFGISQDGVIYYCIGTSFSWPGTALGQ